MWLLHAYLRVVPVKIGYFIDWKPALERTDSILLLGHHPWPGGGGGGGGGVVYTFECTDILN